MKKGFTLVELLVVIAIIGVLAAAILVSVAGARPKAANANVQTAMKTINDEMIRCLSEDGYINNVGPAAAEYSCYSDSALTTQVAGYAALPDLATYGKGTCGANWAYGAGSALVASTGAYTFISTCPSTTAPKTITCNQNSCIQS